MATLTPQGMQKILHAYARRSGNPHVSFEDLSRFAFRFAKRFSAEQPEFGPLNTPERDAQLLAALQELERSGAVELDGERPERVSSVFYRAFFAGEVGRWYRKMQQDKELPFPSEGHLEVTIPSSLLTPVDVADNLMHYLKSEDEAPSQLLLLRFPSGIRSVVVTVRILREDLLPLVLTKIRDYLRTNGNAGYMETKLRTLFSKREMLVHELIEAAHVRPDDALRTVGEPNEFQLHFWTQLSSMIIKEIAGKTEKLEAEHGFCQAAYLLGYYVVLNKGIHQEKAHKEETHRILAQTLQKPPYAFTIQDVYNLTDDKGVALTKRASRDEINDWIERMLTRPSADEVSELVSVNTPERDGVMIHTAQYVPLLLRLAKAATPVLRRELTHAMYRDLREERDEPWIQDETAFERVVSKRVHDEFPLLYGLAQFQTLTLVLEGRKPDGRTAESVQRYIDGDKKKMRPWSEILDLSQQDIYKEARLRLPAWMLIPIVRGIVKLLNHMFSVERPAGTAEAGRAGEDNTTDKAESKQSTEARRRRFRESISEMEREYLGEHETAAQKLKALKRQWNPLLEPTAAENLVEDVNSLCRDAVRRMRHNRNYSAPTRQRVEETAARISEKPAFNRITSRKAFQTYLKLYMLTLMKRS